MASYFSFVSGYRMIHCPTILISVGLSRFEWLCAASHTDGNNPTFETHPLLSLANERVSQMLAVVSVISIANCYC